MLGTRRQFFVRQHPAFLKLSGAYDILDPETQELLATATEVPPTWARYLRLLFNKGFLPTNLIVQETGARQPSFTLHRPAGIVSRQVVIRNGAGAELGRFSARAFSWRSRLRLQAPDGRALGELTGDWKGWDFGFSDPSGKALGRITKKWAGLGKELLTTADSYMISVADGIEPTANLVLLLLASGLAIDLALKEHAG